MRRSLKGLHQLLSRPPRRHPLRLVLRIAAVAVAAALPLSVLAFSIARISPVPFAGPADAAIVLGAAVRDGRPSPVFAERIRHAVELQQAGQVRYLLFTGGVGADEELAESEAACLAAIALGVPASSILIETSSHTTYENLTAAREILARHGLRRVLLVSDPLHLRRALAMARDLGLDALPSPTPTTRYASLRTRTTFLLRETCYLAQYRLQHWLGARRG